MITKINGFDYIVNNNEFKINEKLVDFDYMEGIRFGFKN